MRGDWVSPLLNPLLPVFPETQSHSATRTSLLIAGIPYKAEQFALCGSRAYSCSFNDRDEHMFLFCVVWFDLFFVCCFKGGRCPIALGLSLKHSTILS